MLNAYVNELAVARRCEVCGSTTEVRAFTADRRPSLSDLVRNQRPLHEFTAAAEQATWLCGGCSGTRTGRGGKGSTASVRYLVERGVTGPTSFAEVAGSVRAVRTASDQIIRRELAALTDAGRLTRLARGRYTNAV